MPIPDYQTIMLPLLKYLADQQEHSLREVIDSLAAIFELCEVEKQKLLPSGKQSIFDNRVGWARTYLKKAVLLQSTKRGFFQITVRGSEVLKQNLQSIDTKYLNQFPEFISFKSKTSIEASPVIINNGIELVKQKTPQEYLEDAYLEIKQGLADEIITRIKACSPTFFEKLVVQLLVKMGYGGSVKDAGQAVGRSGDGGIDGIIKEDKLGLDVIYIQAKRWEGTVGRPEIQKFVGALHGFQSKKGVFITTSNFSNDAIDYVSRIDNKIVLINGDRLAQLMLDYSVGVSTVEMYELKKIDEDFFIDE
jgi:restriction system protein